VATVGAGGWVPYIFSGFRRKGEEDVAVYAR